MRKIIKIGLLVTLLVLSTWSIEGYKIGNDHYISFTINWADVPLAPDTLTVWTPPPKGTWAIDSGDGFGSDTFSLCNSTLGHCYHGSTGDKATTNDDGIDLHMFAFGNGVDLDFMIQGMFWCDSAGMFAGDEGGHYSFDGTSYVNIPGVNYFPAGWFATSYYNIVNGRDYDPLDWIWGMSELLASNGNSWTVAPTMSPPFSTVHTLYTRATPLVVQWAKTSAFDLTDPLSGSTTFNMRITRVA